MIWGLSKGVLGCSLIFMDLCGGDYGGNHFGKRMFITDFDKISVALQLGDGKIAIWISKYSIIPSFTLVYVPFYGIMLLIFVIYL